jgi:hypothetical protein
MKSVAISYILFRRFFPFGPQLGRRAGTIIYQTSRGLFSKDMAVAMIATDLTRSKNGESIKTRPQRRLDHSEFREYVFAMPFYKRINCVPAPQTEEPPCHG